MRHINELHGSFGFCKLEDPCWVRTEVLLSILSLPSALSLAWAYVLHLLAKLSAGLEGLMLRLVVNS